MASISSIRAGLKTRLETISGLRAYATWPDSLVAPCAIVGSIKGTYHTAMGSPGFMSLVAEITLYAYPVQQGTQRGVEKVDPYLDVSGSSSIKAAIEGDTALGGVVDSCIVIGFDRNDSLRDPSGVEYWGAVFQVEIPN